MNEFRILYSLYKKTFTIQLLLESTVVMHMHNRIFDPFRDFLSFVCYLLDIYLLTSFGVWLRVCPLMVMSSDNTLTCISYYNSVNIWVLVDFSTLLFVTLTWNPFFLIYTKFHQSHLTNNKMKYLCLSYDTHYSFFVVTENKYPIR